MHTKSLITIKRIYHLENQDFIDGRNMVQRIHNFRHNYLSSIRGKIANHTCFWHWSPTFIYGNDVPRFGPCSNFRPIWWHDNITLQVKWANQKSKDNKISGRRLILQWYWKLVHKNRNIWKCIYFRPDLNCP